MVRSPPLDMRCLKILVLGAGVLGTLYAVKLSQAGHHTSLLARGGRLAELKRDGAGVENLRTGELATAPKLAAVDKTALTDRFDLVLVLVRKTQLASVLPLLGCCGAPTVLFLLNNPEHPSALVDAVGRDRVLLGFPGAGGMLEGGIVRYALIPEQPTTIGELAGVLTPRLRQLASMLREAGLPTATSRDMPSWLKTHAIFVTAVSGALYQAGGSARALAEDTRLLRIFVTAVHEGFAGLHLAGVTVTPWKLDLLFGVLPRAFAIAYWRRYFASPLADVIFTGHARAASDEMAELARECRAFFAERGFYGPELERLWTTVEDVAGGLQSISR